MFVIRSAIAAAIVSTAVAAMSVPACAADAVSLRLNWLLSGVHAISQKITAHSGALSGARETPWPAWWVR